MPQATCRCGQHLTLPADLTQRVVCPQCGARVRIRLRSQENWPADGFIRFLCECGRRLKVPARNRPSHGQCPDCGRVLPIPEPGGSTTMPPGHPETPTAELGPQDRATLQAWIARHTGAAPGAAPPAAQRPGPVVVTPGAEPETALTPGAEGSPVVEAGLRLCPDCGHPLHLRAEVCRSCGSVVPRR
jgi:predicted RNA-binding Zn-ribbon protein involved in translation (DUF1610 family)